MKSINLQFLLLNFCSRKPKCLENWITFMYSMYSVFLRGINRCPRCIKIIFLHCPNDGDYIKIINLHFFLLNFCSKKQKYVEKRTTFKYSMYSVPLRGISRHPICTKTIFLNFSYQGGYVKSINLEFLLLNFCSRKPKFREKWITFMYSMYSVFLRGINRCPMCTKIIFLHSPNEGDYIKIINLHFFLLNFCSKKQKYVEKRTTFKYSMYSVFLRGINRRPMCTKIIFLHSPNEGKYIKLINLHFFLLNFCSKKQKYVEKRTTFKYSMYSNPLRGINRHPICTKTIFLNFSYKGGYVKSINLGFLLLNFCSRKPKFLEKWITFMYSMYSVFLRGINRFPMCIKIIFLLCPNKGDYMKIINLHFFLLNFCSKKQKYVEKRTTFKYSMYSVPLRGINRHPICTKTIFLNFSYKGGYVKSKKLQFLLLNFCSRMPKFLEKWITFMYSMYSVFLRGINMRPMCIKIIFLHSPNEGDYIKIINLLFFHLNFCSKKQKYVEKRTTLKYSMYSVFLRAINRRPKFIEKIFLPSPNKGNYIKIINLHFYLLNFCSKKQKYVEKRTTLKYSMYSVFLRGINRRPMCIKIIFLHSPNEGDYIKIINLHFFFLNFCSKKQKIRGETNYSQVFYIFCLSEGYK